MPDIRLPFNCPRGDPVTGMNITGEVLTESRQEYETELGQVIKESIDRIAKGTPKMKVWEETEDKIKDLQQKLWNAHKGGWLQDWLQPKGGEDRFFRDLKHARNQLGID